MCPGRICEYEVKRGSSLDGLGGGLDRGGKQGDAVFDFESLGIALDGLLGFSAAFDEDHMVGSSRERFETESTRARVEVNSEPFQGAQNREPCFAYSVGRGTRAHPLRGDEASSSQFSCNDAHGSPGFDLGPHLATHLLTRPIFACDDFGNAPSG